MAKILMKLVFNSTFKIQIQYLIFSSVFLLLQATPAIAEKQRIKAIGIPLADHYPGIVAYEKYRAEMQYADYQLLLLPGPKLVRGYFRSEPDADISFNVCPMVMDMFAKKSDFRWISLIHRDGNALCINHLFNKKAKVATRRKDRLPDGRVAEALTEFHQELKLPVEIAIPSRLATHATVLYKYLKDHGKTMGRDFDSPDDATFRIVKPPKSPAFLRKQNNRSKPAAFEQSLPWPEEAEANGSGVVAWYSKDVMNHPLGHVECVIIAHDHVIAGKRQALQEVIYYIHKAGQDIEQARKNGGAELEEIITMIRRHVPAHSRAAIAQSLDPNLNKINYLNLNVDDNAKASFSEIMDLAHEAGFIKKKIDIDALADDSFGMLNVEVE